MTPLNGCEYQDFQIVEPTDEVHEFEDQEIDLPSPTPHIGTYGGDC